MLAFERDNRAYFARSISDRGDAYFADFPARHSAALAEQEAGDCAFFLLMNDSGEVLGRFNLYDCADGGATVGYRLAERVAGRGVATAAVRELCVIASSRFAVQTLTAAASDDNVASQKVLTKTGFVAVGAADPSELGGERGTRYRCDLGVARAEADGPAPVLPE